MKENATTPIRLTRRAWLQWMAAAGAALVVPVRDAVAASKYAYLDIRVPIDPHNPAICFDPAKCIYCGACKSICRRKMGVDSFFDLAKTKDIPICVYCGQCSTVCEGNAITLRPHWQEVQRAKAAGKTIVVSTSPSVRVGLAEAFGHEPGAFCEGQAVALMRQLGADIVLDTSFGADITIMEEAAELLERLKDPAAPMPLMTSCCPSWVSFCEFFYPEYLPNLSRVKSPIAMQGATIKSYFARAKGLDPTKIFNVALTPCPAKKYEVARPELQVNGLRDMDLVVTVRELPDWVRAAGVTYDPTQTSAYDDLMGDASSSGIIFGRTGGVSETILRTAYVMANGTLPPEDFFTLEDLRGLVSARQMMKQATVQLLPNRSVTVVVVQGLANARKVLKALANKTLVADMIEVMACEGGCVGGSGLPLAKTQPYLSNAMRQARMHALQQQDDQEDHLHQRVSVKNPTIQKLYTTFYGAPLSERAKAHLHTSYTSQAHLLGTP